MAMYTSREEKDGRWIVVGFLVGLTVFVSTASEMERGKRPSFDTLRRVNFLLVLLSI